VQKGLCWRDIPPHPAPLALHDLSISLTYRKPLQLAKMLEVPFAMSEIFVTVFALTINIENLCDQRTTACCMGDEKLRDHFQTQIDDLRAQRKRLIDGTLK
jgi:hypothetical protein